MLVQRQSFNEETLQQPVNAPGQPVQRYSQQQMRLAPQQEQFQMVSQ